MQQGNCKILLPLTQARMPAHGHPHFGRGAKGSRGMHASSTLIRAGSACWMSAARPATRSSLDLPPVLPTILGCTDSTASSR